MQFLTRTYRFTRFTLLEYGRSGRVLIDIIATMVVFFLFLRRGDSNAEYFFTVAGIFTPALMLYTMSAMISLGDRPQGYVLLVRKVSRANYLLGLYLAAVLVVLAMYGVACLLTALFNPPVELNIGGWILGTIPLTLNIALLAALMLMLSPLVFASGWRLFVLGLIAVAFSSNFIGGPVLERLPTTVTAVLRAVQTLLGGPLVPAFYGFQLAVTRDYSTATAIANVFAQVSLLVSLLGLSVYAFARRDLIFNNP